MVPDFLSPADWLLLVFCTFTIGFSKAGLRGVNIIAVPIFAGYFGGKTSASILLPLLLTGDVLAMIVYRNKISWRHFLRLLPAALVGLTAGVILGNMIPDQTFRTIMACLVMLCLVLMLIKEFTRDSLTLPDHMLAHSIGGFTGGFSTMVGNAAAPIMAVYLLSMNLPKEIFIGTGAVFFLVLNFVKLPIHLFVWETMVWDTFLLDLILVPGVIISFFMGLKVVKWIPERAFRLFIILGTLAGTVKLFF